VSELERHIDALARQVEPFAPSAERAARTRVRLVDAVASDRGARRWPRRWQLAVGVALAGALAAGTVAVTRAGGGESARGAVAASDGADYAREGAPGREVVRVRRGVMRFVVSPLAAGESFRVVTGDGEVEVRGTEFYVAVIDDRLASVAVAHGTVVVRHAGASAPAVLGAGDHWAPPTPPLPPTPPPATATRAAPSPPAASVIPGTITVTPLSGGAGRQPADRRR
jgi:ferric-dicitrate binding protein FerR (iron transport regulator)